jgi:hypothetical protein
MNGATFDPNFAWEYFLRVEHGLLLAIGPKRISWLN